MEWRKKRKEAMAGVGEEDVGVGGGGGGGQGQAEVALKTKFKRPMFVENGYSYYYEREGKGGECFWRCADRKKLRCLSGVYVREGVVTRRVNDHNHGGDPGQIEARRLYQAATEAAAAQQATNKILLTTITESASDSATLALPDKRVGSAS